MSDCKECSKLTETQILLKLMQDMFKKNEDQILSSYHGNEHNLFGK